MEESKDDFAVYLVLLDNLAHLKILKMRCVVAALTLCAPINASLSGPNNEDSNALEILF